MSGISSISLSNLQTAAAKVSDGAEIVADLSAVISSAADMTSKAQAATGLSSGELSYETSVEMLKIEGQIQDSMVNMLAKYFA